MASSPRYRFHLLSLVHLPQSAKYLSCAFTQKNRKLAKMLIDMGHEVFFYGSEGSDVAEYCGNSPRFHMVQTHTLKDIRRDYGDGDNRFEIGYDWTNTDFRHDFNDVKRPSTIQFYKVASEHINKIKRADDFLLCTMGNYYQTIVDEVKLDLTLEPGVGYRGSVAGRYRAFESSYIQNYTYGSEHPFADSNGSYYDRVIPNYFDPNDVEYSDEKGDYFLFIGRMIRRKGIITAAIACYAAEKTPLIIAGQGASVHPNGHLIPNTDPDFDLKPGSWDYIGFADVEKRKKLMAHAKGVFVPTEYLEIFGGVHIEAMLSGTPVITTNFGVFPGTVPDHLVGKIGYRCDTLQDFVEATRAMKQFSKKDYKFIREYAERFLMENVAKEFQKWFDDLMQVYKSQDGKTPGWHHIKGV